MTQQEFIQTLPMTTQCEHCGAQLDNVQWHVGKYGPNQWAALGIAKCEPCSFVRVAAAGSDDLSHSFARTRRAKFVQAMGTMSN